MPDAAQHPRRRRWLQFGLRTLLAVVALTTGPLLAWRIYIEPFRQQAATMAIIEQLGGTYQSEPGGMAWLRRMFGEEGFQDVTHVNLADCDEPDRYIEHIARLPILRTLVVGGREFKPAHLRRLGSLVSLEGLVLDTTRASAEEINGIRASLPNLTVYESQRRAVKWLESKKQLVACGQPAGPDWLRKIVGDEFFTEVISVDPEWENIGEAGSWPKDSELKDDDVAYLERLTSLEHLGVANAHLALDGLARLAPLAHLRELDLTRTKIASLAPLASLQALESLSLKECEVKGEELLRLQTLPKLRHLDLGWTELADLSRLAHLKGLERLELNGCPFRPEELHHLWGLPRLRTLGLFATHLADDGLRHLRGLGQLRKLDLSRTEITDKGLPHLQPLKNLEELNLDYNRITDDGLPHLEALSRLKSLYIADKFIAPVLPYSLITKAAAERLEKAIPGLEFWGAIDFDLASFRQKITDVRNSKAAKLALQDLEVLHLEEIADLESLKTLDLSDTIVDDDALQHLRKLTNLEELVLSETWVTDSGLAHLAELCTLRRLDLSGTRVTDAGLKYLSNLRNVESLNLDNCPIRGAGLTHLASCKRLSELRLTSVDASKWPSSHNHKGVTKQGLQALSTFDRLQNLSFSGTEITDHDLAVLASLKNLQSVDVQGTKIQGPGLRHLQALRALRELTFSGNALTDEAVPHLAALSQVTNLNLDGEEHVTQQGLKRLRKLLPPTCKLSAFFNDE